MKRLTDIVLAGFVGLFSFPFVALAAVAIRLESPGSPFFVQERLGKDEAVFACYKLRTMRTGTENVASHLVSSSEITRVGGLLRALKLDELPQVINVMQGDMSFVGPRPGLPNDSELTTARRLKGVFAASPGITGLAQVQNIDMSEPRRLAEVDRQYLDTRTLRGDFMLLFETVTGGGRGDAVASVTSSDDA